MGHLKLLVPPPSRPVSPSRAAARRRDPAVLIRCLLIPKIREMIKGFQRNPRAWREDEWELIEAACTNPTSSSATAPNLLLLGTFLAASLEQSRGPCSGAACKSCWSEQRRKGGTGHGSCRTQAGKSLQNATRSYGKSLLSGLSALFSLAFLLSLTMEAVPGRKKKKRTHTTRANLRYGFPLEL